MGQEEDPEAEHVGPRVSLRRQQSAVRTQGRTSGQGPPGISRGDDCRGGKETAVSSFSKEEEMGGRLVFKALTGDRHRIDPITIQMVLFNSDCGHVLRLI